MTSIKEFETPTNSLKAGDLEGAEHTLKIKSYEIKEFENDGKKTKKPVFSFEGTNKTLVCNITNLRSIAYAYGDEMDQWVGKEITLYPTVVSFGNDQVEAIRVRVVRKGGAAPKFMDKELDDEIPF